MNHLHKLAEHFQRFPGIGPRQAKRFVYHLLRQDKDAVKDLAERIKELQKHIAECSECHRFYDADGYADVCDICSSPNRDTHLLMVVEKDADLDAIEKSGVYHGRYFVLGGTVPILERAGGDVRTDALKTYAAKRVGELTEVILAMSANPEGEVTAQHVRSILEPVLGKDVRFSMLGRGLSTGTELEYSDTDTIKSALENRR